jgi:hypothetical protein
MTGVEGHEHAALKLNDAAERREAFERFEHYKLGFVPHVLGKLIIGLASRFYGRAPSYVKFRAIEIIARIPYQSWEVFSYCAQTLFFADEERALRLSTISEFSRVAQDNETMHVVVISQLMKKHGDARFLRSTIVPMFMAFVYAGISFVLYGIKKRWSFELNYYFEHHAYLQYQEFLDSNEAHLKANEANCGFLDFYGRKVRNEYEFFELVRNDELLHRNMSVESIHHYCAM